MKNREVEKKSINKFFMIGIILLELFLIPVNCYAAGALEDLGDL